MSSTGVTMPVWHEKHLRAATPAAGIALWAWNVDTDAITMDERAYELWEVSKSETKITFEILSKNIHPPDLERVRSALPLLGVGSYEIVGSCPAATFVGFRRGAKAMMLTSLIGLCSVSSSMSPSASRLRKPTSC